MRFDLHAVVTPKLLIALAALGLLALIPVIVRRRYARRVGVHEVGPGRRDVQVR
jgi:hypothetical protein